MNLAQIILDMDVQFMKSTFRLIDTQLNLLSEGIDKEFKVYGDSSLLDDAEYLYGIGFVLGQRFLTSTYAICNAAKPKHELYLASSPKHVGDFRRFLTGE